MNKRITQKYITYILLCWPNCSQDAIEYVCELYGNDQQKTYRWLHRVGPKIWNHDRKGLSLMTLIYGMKLSVSGIAKP